VEVASRFPKDERGIQNLRRGASNENTNEIQAGIAAVDPLRSVVTLFGRMCRGALCELRMIPAIIHRVLHDRPIATRLRIIMDRPMMYGSCAPASAIMTLTDRATTAYGYGDW